MDTNNEFNFIPESKWTKNAYNPTVSSWYVVRVNGRRDILMYNNVNTFWCDLAGKTYKVNEIEDWLHDKY